MAGSGEDRLHQLDRSTADSTNMAVLTRMDPSITGVVATAGHVALYEFNSKDSTWVRHYNVNVSHYMYSNTFKCRRRRILKAHCSLLIGTLLNSHV
jgi:hypothetical protein